MISHNQQCSNYTNQSPLMARMTSFNQNNYDKQTQV